MQKGKVGRPPIIKDKEILHMWLSRGLKAKLLAAATKKRMSLSEHVREVLESQTK